MPGLSASDLHPASLCAGDTIEYSSRIFVSGDPRGHHSSVVLYAHDDIGTDYPHRRGHAGTHMMVRLTVDQYSYQPKLS
ncbi:hypothetical protein F442_08926 [Phytophthora nicotianae P10297]|uniref:Uncharacterized protein n=4 Tax=Phytophthora nicotianae TaxID=4792 RepID=W2ZE72_PHYNI|nr:hypothetical protein L917_08660 [Phytophthora nicotianae]ETO75323.1 hypothetical protein F444_09055 [Phytophthora nicotianae P1976]ETP44484.1 hypothetical protein F442_08926 [Phytophthora nicotianae P10297]